MPAPYDHEHENEVMPFASTNFRGAKQAFGIKTDDRRRHIYVVGKTGMGKTTLLENMVLHDINAGHGVAYIDPHGDTASNLLDFIPPNRINDVVYFNPADMEFPIGFNPLEVKSENEKHLVASGMMGVFKKIWEGVWSPRMEYIMLNCILALLDVPGSTMLGIARILADKEYRKKTVAQIKDPAVRSFWVNEFAGYSERFASEAIAPIQNKVGQFLSASITRNIVAQSKSTFNLREVMDERKIFIANLSKGLVGEDSSRLLGAMLITKLQLAAMERVDMPEGDRQDFYLYVDEFQNFSTESFASILSEARKYRLNLITAHQYIEQLDETVAAAIFGNVGTIISFRVGAQDAETLAREFAPVFTEEDVINLAKFEIYLKLMIDGVASAPFSANTLPPIAKKTGTRDKVIDVSRERNAIKRAVIEEKVLQWSEYMFSKKDDKKSGGKSKFSGGGDFRTKKPGAGSGGGDFRTKKAADKPPLPPPPKEGMFGGKIRIAKDEAEEKIVLPQEAPKREKKEAPKVPEPAVKEKSPPKTPQEKKPEPKKEAPAVQKGRRPGPSADSAPRPQESTPKMPRDEKPKPAAVKAPVAEKKVVQEKKIIQDKIVREKVEEKKPKPPQLKPLPKLQTNAPQRTERAAGDFRKKKKKKKRPPLPPPPGDGSFTGKIRIVQEDERPSVVLRDEAPKPEKKPERKRAPKKEEKKPNLPPPPPPKFPQEPDIQVPPGIDDGPKKLDPGETISFE